MTSTPGGQGQVEPGGREEVAAGVGDEPCVPTNWVSNLGPML